MKYDFIIREEEIIELSSSDNRYVERWPKKDS